MIIIANDLEEKREFMFRSLILRFCVVLLVTVFSFSSAMVEAGESEMRQFLPKLSGTWKDMAGNTVLDRLL